MNPAALKANVGDLPAGGILIVNTDEFTKRNLTKVGYDGLAAGRRLARALHGAPGRDGDADPRRAGGDRACRKKDAERAKNMFALGLLSWMYHRPTEGTERFLREKFAKRPGPGRGERAGVPGRARLRRDHRVVRRDLRGRAGAAARGHVPADHRQHRAGLRDRGRRAGHRAAGVPRLVPDHAGLRHPARAEQAQGLRRHDLPGRGRDRRRRRRAGRGVRRRAGRDHHLRPRDLAQERDDRAGRRAGAAAAGDRRAARRPVDGAAHQDRAGRPAAGDVRPQRRGAAADPRAALARRLLRHRAGGRPDRGDLPDAGDRAVRRLGGQRLGAVAGPGRRRAAARRPGVRHGAELAGRRRVLALPARRRHPRPPLGRPRHAGAGAPHRRPGEGRRPRLDLLRPRQPRPHGPAARGQDRRNPRAGRRGRRPERRRRAAGARLGLDLRADRRRRPPGAQARPLRSPRRTCATSTRCRPTSARSCAATAGCWCRR